MNKKLTLGTLLAMSLFVGQNAEAKEKNLPKFKPFSRVTAKALEVAADKIEGKILWDFLDSAAALTEKDPRPYGKKALPVFKKLADMVKNPTNFSLEERAEALENFVNIIDQMSIEDKVVRHNDKAALAKAADILVNNSWSLPGQQMHGAFMFLRIMTEGMVAFTGNANTPAVKEFQAANTILKRPWNHSVKEVTDALVSIEKNTPIITTEVLTKLENIDPKNFTFTRDFKEYQVCLAYMPQAEIAPAKA